MAGEKTVGYAASVFETENTNGVFALCSKQSPGKIRARRYRKLPFISLKVGEDYDGFNQL